MIPPIPSETVFPSPSRQPAQQESGRNTFRSRIRLPIRAVTSSHTPNTSTLPFSDRSHRAPYFPSDTLGPAHATCFPPLKRILAIRRHASRFEPLSVPQTVAARLARTRFTLWDLAVL